MPAMSELKSAFVGIIGRPSSGKSTFLNSVCGRKVSIVSTVPQTTRNKIRGICHSSTGQLVFVDTPGYHISNKRMNNRIKNVVLSAIHEVDILLHIADISRLFGEEERSILSLLTAFPGPTIIALNKIDCKKTFRKEFLEKIRQLTTHTPYLEISGLYGNGIPELLSELFSMAPIGEQFYPKEFYTDQPPEFRISVHAFYYNMTKSDATNPAPTGKMILSRSPVGSISRSAEIDAIVTAAAWFRRINKVTI